MTNYLEVKSLSKSFDSFQLHNISFTLPKGYIMGLIGPNGSGKTTTIKLILNMLKRNGGEIKIMGLDNIADEQKAKAELGVVFDTNYFSDDWQVTQVEKIHLRFLSQLEVGTVCRDAAEVPHYSHQESERTLKGDADEVDAGLCVLLRCKAADPGRTHQRPRSGFQR